VAVNVPDDTPLIKPANVNVPDGRVIHFTCHVNVYADGRDFFAGHAS
jgi:hypothetical protein